MRRLRSAITLLLLLAGMQYTLPGNLACASRATGPGSALAVSVSHSMHGHSQHHRGEHPRQHCLTSVTCLLSLSPDVTAQPDFTASVHRAGQLNALPELRGLLLEPTTPPPRV